MPQDETGPDGLTVREIAAMIGRKGTSNVANLLRYAGVEPIGKRKTTSGAVCNVYPRDLAEQWVAQQNARKVVLPRQEPPPAAASDTAEPAPEREPVAASSLAATGSLMPAIQRPHDTKSGGNSAASSFTEALRPVKMSPAKSASMKPRATREGIRRDSASGASIAGADICFQVWRELRG